LIANPDQPREYFDEAALEELAQSIREGGLLQPLVVRPSREGMYEVIAGERRLRAAKIVGLTSVPVIMRAAGNESALEIALIENLQREDISPLECARAYRRLMDEFGLTQEQVADKVGKARASIANTVRLLRLPKKILDGIETGTISEGHARALLSLDNEIMQLAVYDQIVTKGLSVREAETLARPKEGAAKSPKKRLPGEIARADSPEWRELQDGLSMYFGTPVRLEKADVGGRMVVSFYSDDDLMRILDVLGIHV
jgi:ParB family chromosome partitioning protein